MSRAGPSAGTLMGGLGALVAALFVGSLMIGPAGLGPWESLRALAAAGPETAVIIMQEIRLPRALLGLMVGASLGLSGAALQGYLRNPLAEPALIGISPAAALGAVVAIYTGLASAFALALPAFALVGAMAAAALLQTLAGSRATALSLILAGIAVSAFAGALTTLALNLAPNPFAAYEIVFWMLGSLADRSMEQVELAAPFMVAGWLVLALLGRGLDALSLGEEAAGSLGIRLPRLRLLLVLGTAASVGAAVAVAGTIGFVGLVVPHLLRPLVGARPSRLLAASALGGAAMVLAADIAVRVVLPERDLKLGVLTALIGAPFFLRLVLAERRRLL